MIRVLVAEDSVTVREFLAAVFAADPEIQVVGQARNGVEAVRMTKELKPDVVTMDINMPLMDGLEATKHIMSEAATPIVIVSGTYDTREMEVSMQALRMGALAVIAKPSGPGSPHFKTSCRELVDTVKAMADVKVVPHRSWRRSIKPGRPAVELLHRKSRLQVIGVASSTGGPAALQTVLSSLPASFPVPILIVQHIGKDFASGLASWLGTICPLRVKTSEPGERIEPSTVYVAPDGYHLGISANGDVVHSDDPPIAGFRPSATYLYDSIGRAHGAAALGVVLSGMGRDGTDGLATIKACGGRVLVQDEATSVVFGMPGAAIEAGHADAVLPLQGIASQLLELV